MLRRILRILPPWTLTVAVAAAILYLTLIPRPLPDDMPELFPGADKVVHGIMFAALAGVIVIDRCRSAAKAPSRRLMLAAAGIATAAGALIELLQLWMAMGRGCEAADFAADTVGAFIGGWIGSLTVRKLRLP